jgi:dTDP-4-amino-4,6-dideoxygalactose transaminase
MSAPIPMLDLTAQHVPLRDEIRAAIDRVVDSGTYILGPEVAAFEQEMQRRLGVKHAVACANGSDGLVIALQALGVGPGDEVITTSFSFFASAGSVGRLGATPVFVDIEPTSFNIDPAAVEARITEKTKVILPVHLFGQMAPMKPILEIARRHGLRVVEDAAQAIDAREGSAAAGTLGDVGVLSFFPSKNLGCLGDGGMILTHDDELARLARSLRAHGAGEVRYHHDHVGMNSRLDALQAAVLRVKLPHLTAWAEARRRIADRYDALLAGIGGLETPARLPQVTHVFNQYTIRVARRDALRAALQAEGIGATVYYPRPLHLQRCFASLGGKLGNCPEAERAAREVLSLPVYGELTGAQVERIAGAVKRYLLGGGVL